MRVTLIPARSGSARLPGKNYREINGLPLIAWTIRAALESKVSQEVFVSTDSPRIAGLASKYGASVPFLRPKNLSTSSARSEDVLNHFLEHFPQVETVFFLQPTSPLRNAKHIAMSSYLFEQLEAPAVVSAAQCDEANPFAVRVVPSAGNSWVRSDTSGIGSKYLRANGAIYILDAATFHNSQTFFPEGTSYFEMDSISSIDIDYEEDFAAAEKFMVGGWEGERV